MVGYRKTPTMSELPSRESFKRSGVTLTDASPILAAWVREELKTEAEWREGIDWEAAETELLHTVFMLEKDDNRTNPVDAARAIVDAALEVSDDD